MVQSIMGMHAKQNAALAVAFTTAAAAYWLTVWPRARHEIVQWQLKAQSIPAPSTRRLALETLRDKWANLEGAAAFAAFAPHRRRPRLIHALISWQAAYDIADTLGEIDGADSYELHRPLATALQRDPVFDASSDRRLGGSGERYLRELAYAAGDAYRSLPSHPTAAAAAVRGAQRIATYQALNHRGDHRALRAWASKQTPACSGLAWWETAAAAASSLLTLAMIAAAATPDLSTEDAERVEAAQWPWAAALHTLLDSLTDMTEDIEHGQPSLLQYATHNEIATHLKHLAKQTILHARALNHPRQQIILIAGMTSVYLSAPEAHSPPARPIASAVAAGVGGPVKAAQLLLWLRRRRQHS